MPKISMYDYQMEAISNMKKGCILCGGVGSGKSRTSLAYYYICNGGKIGEDTSPMNSPKDLYIITTARKRDTFEWDNELIPFLLATDPKLNYYKNKVVIDSWNNIKKYADVEDAFFIFDEQRVVGYGAWSKTFIKIARSNHWILLSATPGDNWMDYMPVFIANGFYKHKTDFCMEHVVWSNTTKYQKVDRYLNTRKLVRLRDSILVDMDFNRPTVAHDETIITPYDILAYKSLMKNRWNSRTELPIRNASELCYELRRVVNSDDSRQMEVLKIVEDHPRVIIFYSFNYELDILKDLYYGEDVEIAEWNGHCHQPIPETEKWVYLVQYSSGCEGWNCIKTDTIIFFSQVYSYKMLAQAKGRIDRLNTPYRDLYYYHLRSTAPIDLAIHRALTTKKRFSESKFAGFA